MARDTAPVAPPAPADEDEGGTARINFRLPAHLKARVEDAAGREGLSVNAWLVRAVSGAMEPGGAVGGRGGSRTRGRGPRATRAVSADPHAATLASASAAR